MIAGEVRLLSRGKLLLQILDLKRVVVVVVVEADVVELSVVAMTNDAATAVAIFAVWSA